MTTERAQQIRTYIDVQSTRRGLTAAVWGDSDWPIATVATRTRSFEPSSVADLDSLVMAGIPAEPLLAGLWASAEELSVAVHVGDEVHVSHSYHFRSGTERLAIVHHGHGDDFGSGGYRLLETARELLSRQFSVLFMYMPNYGPAPRTPDDIDPQGDRHGPIFSGQAATNSNMAFRPFLEPVIACLNYLATADAYDQVHMIGLSGGGWTTDLCAALDARIRCSISVAGSLPLDLRFGSSVGDEEQMNAALFGGVVGYRDLYTLAGYGAGRSHYQFLNEHDSCCFSDDQARPGEVSLLPDLLAYATDIGARLTALRAGEFELVRFNDNDGQHRVSPQATRKAIQLFTEAVDRESPLYFHAADGLVAHGVVAGNGRYSYLGCSADPQVGFTHVIATRDDYVLLYDSASGRAIRTGIRPSSGPPAHSVTSLGRGWTSLAVGNPGGCLLYNAVDGTARTGNINGSGEFVDGGAAVPPLPAGCTHIVGTPHGHLLVLDAATGTGIIGRLDSHGLALTGQELSLGSGWTSVVSVNDQCLLLYSATTAATIAMLFDSATDVPPEVLSMAAPLPKGANHVVGASNGALLFLREADSTGTMWLLDEFADIRFVEELGGFAAWAHIVAG